MHITIYFVPISYVIIVIIRKYSLENFVGQRIIWNIVNLVTLLQDTEQTDISLLWMVRKIRQVGALFNLCKIFKVYRERVVKAHLQATLHVKC